MSRSPVPHAGKKSNIEVGADTLTRLAHWLHNARVIPERVIRGERKANISAISAAAEVDRQVLYRPEAQAMIAKAVQRVGLGMPDQQHGPSGSAASAAADRRIKFLEEQLAITRAEVRDLRTRLRRFEHIEQHMVQTGMLVR